MKNLDIRRPLRLWSVARFHKNRKADADAPTHSGLGSIRSQARSTASAESLGCEPAELRRSIHSTALAFRGYDVQNLGRSKELLDHPVYGELVLEVLEEVSQVASKAVGREIDLVDRVRREAPTSLSEFPEDVALIVAMQWAQLRLLETFFHVPIREAKMSIGYSIGELTALILGGTYRMDQLLPIPLKLADDCAELAKDTSMAVLFTRGSAFKTEDVERMCRAVSGEGHGLVGPSAYLAPNTALLLGQGDTLSRIEAVMHTYLPQKVCLRRNPHRWPPLHSPLVWRKNVPNRTAILLYETGGGETPPIPPVLSCVTGEFSYDGKDSRSLLINWTDHPQRLWDAIDGALAAGVQTVIHIGPAPNLIPSTFERLSNNVRKQLGHPMLRRLGHDVAHTLQRHAWLAHLLPSRASLLRVPWLNHIILEDWLLARPVEKLVSTAPREGRLTS